MGQKIFFTNKKNNQLVVHGFSDENERDVALNAAQEWLLKNYPLLKVSDDDPFTLTSRGTNECAHVFNVYDPAEYADFQNRVKITKDDNYKSMGNAQ